MGGPLKPTLHVGLFIGLRDWSLNILRGVCGGEGGEGGGATKRDGGGGGACEVLPL